MSAILEFRRIRTNLAEHLIYMVSDPATHEIYKLPDDLCEKQFSDGVQQLDAAIREIHRPLRGRTMSVIYAD